MISTVQKASMFTAEKISERDEEGKREETNSLEDFKRYTLMKRKGIRSRTEW